MDIEKLKVPELRAELATRGLDTKGTKPVSSVIKITVWGTVNMLTYLSSKVLVARLKEHLGPQAFEATATEAMEAEEDCQVCAL